MKFSKNVKIYALFSCIVKFHAAFGVQITIFCDKFAEKGVHYLVCACVCGGGGHYLHAYICMCICVSASHISNH